MSLLLVRGLASITNCFLADLRKLQWLGMNDGLFYFTRQWNVWLTGSSLTPTHPHPPTHPHTHTHNTQHTEKMPGIIALLCGDCHMAFPYRPPKMPLQWRHNTRDGVSNHQPHHCLLNRLFRLRATGLCAGNSPVTIEFPAQMANNAENVSIWWRHHDKERPHGISSLSVNDILACSYTEGTR